MTDFVVSVWPPANVISAGEADVKRGFVASQGAADRCSHGQLWNGIERHEEIKRGCVELVSSSLLNEACYQYRVSIVNFPSSLFLFLFIFSAVILSF